MSYQLVISMKICLPWQVAAFSGERKSFGGRQQWLPKW